MNEPKVRVTIEKLHGEWEWTADTSVDGKRRSLNGLALTRSGAKRKARKAARELLDQAVAEHEIYTLTRDDFVKPPLTKGMVYGKGKPPTTPPPPAASVKRAGR